MGIRGRSHESHARTDAPFLNRSVSVVWPPTRGVALSVDLACADARDIGVALVTYESDGVLESLHACSFDVPQRGRPTVEPLAEWLRALADEHGATCLCIDGPLGWKGPHTDSLHCRLSERAVRAPGKTGLPPDGVKPRTYLAFTTFSIALFAALRAPRVETPRVETPRAWALPGELDAPSGAGTITESFPTAAWRALGLAPLIAKGRASDHDVQDGVQRLEAHPGLHWRGLHGLRTHDQLQAVVGGIAGAWWAAGQRSRVQLAGAAPFLLDGSWREGYIMIPAVTA